MLLKSLRGDSLCARTPATTLSMIDIGNGLGRWNTMPTLRRNSIRSRSLKMLCPFNSTSPLYRCPETLSFIRFSLRRKVVLPEPVGPSKDVTARAGKSRLTASSTVLAPNPRVRSTALMTGAAPLVSTAPVSALSCSHFINLRCYFVTSHSGSTAANLCGSSKLSLSLHPSSRLCIFTLGSFVRCRTARCPTAEHGSAARLDPVAECVFVALTLQRSCDVHPIWCRAEPAGRRRLGGIGMRWQHQHQHLVVWIQRQLGAGAVRWQEETQSQRRDRGRKRDGTIRLCLRPCVPGLHAGLQRERIRRRGNGFR